jgi:hypothetical protein
VGAGQLRHGETDGEIGGPGEARSGGDDEVLRRIDPLALIVDAGECTDGANDGIGGGHDARRFLDDVAEREADVAAAAIEKVDGDGVPVDGAAADFVFLGDFGGTVPSKETLLDGLAIGMRTDGAVALVVFERAGGGRKRRRR